MEWVIGVGIASLIVGIGVGYLLFGRGGGRAKVAELESALETAQDELKDYRAEVYDQFAETAEKFKNLDRSYQDLHRQLAVSSAALIGDQATPLLSAPDGQTAEAQAVSADEGDVLEGEAEAALTPEHASTGTIDGDVEPDAEAQRETEGQAEEQAAEPAEEQVEGPQEPTEDTGLADEAIASPVDVEVPTLTDEPSSGDGDDATIEPTVSAANDEDKRRA